MRLHTLLAISLAVGCGGVQEQGDGIPAIETITPVAGPQAGGTQVTLTGTAFDFSPDVPTRVVLGAGVVDATVVDDATITFTTPPGAVGSVDVIVFNGGGATVAVRGFAYAPLPTVASISPELASAGATVTVRGSGFQLFEAGTPSVAIDGATLTNVQVLGDAELTGELPGAPGEVFAPVDVEVTTANGSATLAQSFRYKGQGLLGLTSRQSGHRWYYIDPTNGDARKIGNSILPIQRAAAAQTGEIFVIADNASTGSFTRLGRLEFADLSVNNQLDMSVPLQGGALEIDGSDLFFLDRRQSILRRFSLTGVEQNAAAVTLTARAAPTCIFRNNATTLFTITQMDGDLRTVNKTTGAIVVVAALTNGQPATFCHGAARIGGDVFVLGHRRSPRETTLFRLATATGVLTEVGLIRDRDDQDRVDMRITSLVQTPPDF